MTKLNNLKIKLDKFMYMESTLSDGKKTQLSPAHLINYGKNLTFAFLELSPQCFNFSYHVECVNSI